MLVQPTPQSVSDVVPPSSGATAAPDRPKLTMTTETRGHATILTMAGQLVSETAVTTEARILTTIVLAEQPLHLALDLSGVDTIDAHGANLLAKARFTVRAARGTLHLIVPQDAPARRMLSRHLLRCVVERAEDLPLADDGAEVENAA
ncbi:STAS domain-containing protein [Actinomadura graeca]|uniref:STAS domain-containing protein n=1 Tax=Actinomadura graeca TaxID=2750812 RepID=A0ABX8QVP1_9ACTN|nr:STAS domain-containing protein [Actinomadura graeca]QXJ22816.1 STAS domain-containing protein [Actinomadura graeca]